MGNGQEMVEALVNGQKNLDRMKFEISETIHILFGLLGLEEVHKQMQNDRLDFFLLQPHWYLVKSGPTVFTIGYMEPDDSMASGYRSVYESKTHVMEPPPSRDVQKIWSALPLLISGLEEKFPQLTERLKPFREASKVIF